MGTIKQGILGGFSGKVGGVVGSSWKGIAVMKAKPLSVANPQTAGQVAQRTAFGKIVSIASPALAGFIKPLWDRFASQQSGYNAFCGTNVQYVDGNGAVTFASLVASKGRIAATTVTDFTANDGETTIEATWATALPNAYALATDEAYGLLLDDDGNVLASASFSAARSAGTGTLTVNRALVAAEPIHFYLSFLRADGTQVSDSVYYTQQVA